MNKRCILILIMLVVGILTSACSSPRDKTDSAVSHEDTVPIVQNQQSTDNVETPAYLKDFVMPTAEMRPYAVMIDNEGSRPLPQGGLDKAQVIYEIIVEGGVTRLMPVFWGVNPEMIGPVRSARHYFIDYAMEHNAIYVHFGWSPMAQKDISKYKINNINGIANGGEIFWDITNDRKNWQDSYTSMKKITDYVTKKTKYETQNQKKMVFTYNAADTELAAGIKAEKIGIRYSNDYTCSFVYNPETKTYLRFRKDQPHMERVSGQQLKAKNIIVQYVVNSDISGDDKDRQELGDVGNGSGWYITDGKAIEINWSKKSRFEQTIYEDKSGNPITINPGQTWVQIVPAVSKISME